jgi:acetoin utilization deacetylase AcuC-like enzyme
VGLPDGVGDEAYLRALDMALEKAWDFCPTLVFYNAGWTCWRGTALGGWPFPSRG